LPVTHFLSSENIRYCLYATATAAPRRLDWSGAQTQAPYPAMGLLLDGHPVCRRRAGM